MLKKTVKSTLSKQGVYLVKVFLLALIYYASGKFSLAISQHNLIVTITIFASEGFSLAALLLFGKNLWPGIFIGQLTLALSTGVPFLPSAGIAAINSIEALLGATLFKIFNLNKSLTHTRDVFGLLAIIAFILQPFSAITGNCILLASSVISTSEFSQSLYSWWFGNVMGQFLLTPLILLINTHRKMIKIPELLLIISLFSTLSYCIFIAFSIKSLPIVFSITMPLVIIISAYRTLAHALIIVLINALIAIHATVTGIGAFSSGNPTNDVIDVNFYILSHILLLLTIGTLICEKKHSEKKLRALALFDPLTGLPNRNLLKERMSHAIAMAHRFNIKSAICFIDIDGFKAVNDTLGHHAGDRVINIVAQRIKKYMQEDDSLIRLGGDEFLLIAIDMRTTRRIKKLLDKISTSVNEPIFIGEEKALVSLSIGIAICSDDSDSSSSLITLADTAMYQAKSRGKNQYVFYKDLTPAELAPKTHKSKPSVAKEHNKLIQMSNSIPERKYG